MVHHVRTFVQLAWMCVICLTLPAIAQQASFQIIPTPGSFGTNVQALAVSADGQVVIGEYFLSDQDPTTCTVFGGCTRTFRWTAQTGAQDIGVIVDKTQVFGHRINADGSQIVGEAYDLNSFKRAFIWTSSIGVQDLGTPIFTNDSSHSESEAYGISASGAVIAGRAIPTQSSLIPQAFQFKTTTVPASFLFLPFPSNGFQSEARAVSADGTTEAGTSFDNSSAAHAVRWRAGMVLDLTPNGNGVASDYAVSADGSTVVGTFSVSGVYHAFRWTAAGGLQDLGSLGSGSYSYGNAVSADGSVVVGSATPSGGGVTRAFRWTARKGFEDLNSVLANLRVNTNGYQLVYANGISADGTIIVGMAENATLGVDDAFIAVVPLPACAPVSCASLAKNCGTISDGCGGTLTCGSCSGSLTCGGGGTANVCGPLTPTTSCGAQGKNCGAIPDGAGGWLACGSCTSPAFCGGGGTPNVCAVPPPVPQSLTFNPNAVAGGSNSTGTVTLTEPAPTGGAVVTLNSSNTSVATVPANVTVPGGSTSANFVVKTVQPPQDTVSMISACYGGQCITSTLYVTAPTVITVASLTLSPPSVTGGGSSQGTVTLSGAPPGGATVALSSNAAAATVPASVIVPAGATSATFTVSTQTVTSATTATITATLGSSSQQASLTINPASSGPTISSVTLNPTSVVGGNNSTGTVTLSSAAPSGGSVVSLSSNSSSASVPGSVTVPSGSTSANFTVTTTSVTSTTIAVIKATLGSSSQQASLTINPASGSVTLSSLTLNPTSVSGRNNSTGTVTLSGAAPSGGATVTLSSSNTSVATVPSSVTVSAGQTSASFRVSTQRVQSNTNVTISATYAGTTKQATLTVTSGR